MKENTVKSMTYSLRGGGMALPSYLNPLGVPPTGEKAFVQPVLAANGTLGGSSFAVAGSSLWDGDYWWAFDNDAATRWHSSGGMPQWMTIYNPEPLKLRKLTITTSSNSGHKGITAGSVLGSNDNVSWETIAGFSNSVTDGGATFDIPVNSGKFFKYHQLHITGSAYSTWIGTCAVIAEIKLDAVTPAEFLYN